MATTFILKRKTFAAINPAALSRITFNGNKVMQKAGQAAVSAGNATKAGGGFLDFGFGHLKNAFSGTAGVNATLKNGKTLTGSMQLTGKERALEAAKGVGKLGATTAAIGIGVGALGAKKVDDAANGLV